MQALAVQASSGTESSADRSTIQEQYQALLRTITAVSTIQYNSIALLDPTNPSEITYAANALPTEVIDASENFRPQNGPPSAEAPIITAITFTSIGTPNGSGWTITLHGVNFQAVAPLDNNEDSPNFSMVVGPLMTDLSATNNSSEWVWAQFGYTSPTNTNWATLDYSQSSSTTLTIHMGAHGFPGLVPGHYVNFAVAGPDGHWALWQGAIPNAPTTITVPFPTHILTQAQSTATALSLPVVTPITLGLETLSLATASSATDASHAIQTAALRLSQAQAQIGSQQDGMQAQMQTLQTTSVQTQTAIDTLTHGDLAQITAQLANTQAIQHFGLQMLVTEQSIGKQTARMIFPG